jgi:hypothetical protein
MDTSNEPSRFDADTIKQELKASSDLGMAFKVQGSMFKVETGNALAGDPKPLLKTLNFER